MIKTYDKTGLCILIPESVREAVIIKYIKQLFYLDMIDYQTQKEKETVKQLEKHLKQLEALL